MPLIQKIYFSTLIFCMATMFYMMSLNSPPNSKDSNPPPPSDPTHLRSNFLDTSPVKNSTPVPQNMIYHFRKPELAQKVLKQLDVFTPVHDSFFGGRTGTKNKYHIPYLGLKNDNKYCDKHRTHFINHPEVVFDQQNFLLSEEPDSFFRGTVVPLVGTDMNPQIGDHMAEPYKRKALFRLKPETNVFFTKTAVNVYKHIGKHFSCLSQISNHIPGHYMLSRKDFVAEGAIEYEKKFVDRPQCFNHDKFFPKTWLLYDKEDCLDFFASLNSVQYQELKKDKGIIYIRKVGVYSHRGEGVQPVDEEEEAALRGNYSDGALCGKVPQNYIIQHFIYNPLLLDGRKFDFRMYMLIASTNPLMAYYHDGFLRVSLMQYDPHSTEKQVLLTNLALNNKIYEDARDGHYYEGMDEEGLKRTQQWSFDQLQGYLLEKGMISDENWLDNYLRPEFKKAMIHLLRLSSDKFLKDSSVYELYGVDFMLDTNLNLWFIEANAGPAFKGYSEPMEKFIIKMLKDHFEIMFGLMRSRMKRVVGYVNGLIDNGGIKVLEDGKVKVLELNENREVFKMITQNYFEKEYEPKADNGFSKIVDGKYTGVRMYQGLISQECL